MTSSETGLVVLCHGDGEAFEVEFVTGEGQTVAVLTLKAQEVRLTQAQEILRARDLAE